MPQGIQGSSVGDQLRRGFGLRGLISTAVDEVLVPVAHARNLDAPPFRTDGIRWWMQIEQTAPAGQIPMISLVAARPGTVIVDSCTMGTTGATGDFHIGWGTDIWFPPNGAQSSELPGFDPAVNVVNVPARLLVATVNAPYAGAVPFARYRGIFIKDILVDQPLNAPEGQITTSMRFLNFTVASQLYVTVTGRFWNNVS